MAPGSGRMDVLSISEVHSDSLGVVMGLLSSGCILDATAIRLFCTQ